MITKELVILSEILNKNIYELQDYLQKNNILPLQYEKLKKILLMGIDLEKAIEYMQSDKPVVLEKIRQLNINGAYRGLASAIRESKAFLSKEKTNAKLSYFAHFINIKEKELWEE